MYDKIFKPVGIEVDRGATPDLIEAIRIESKIYKGHVCKRCGMKIQKEAVNGEDHKG